MMLRMSSQQLVALLGAPDAPAAAGGSTVPVFP